jgi:hypothetical protein
MIENKVKNKLYVARFAKVSKLYKVLLFTKSPVYLVIVLCIILMIRRRRENWGEPDALNAKALAGIDVTVVEVIKVVDNTAKIAKSVLVCISKRTYEYLVECSVVIINRVNYGRKIGLIISKKAF